MCFLSLLFFVDYLPGDSPADMVGYSGVSIVSPGWTNLGKEHSVLWFVALDCRDEPEQATFKEEKNP